MPSLAIVPAAGRAERFGRQKLLEDLGGELLLNRTIRCLLDGGVTRVAVVVPPQGGLDAVPIFADPRVELVLNPDPSRGMFSSIQAAFAAIPEGDPVLVLPGDMVPALRAAVAGIDRNLPISNVRSLDEIVTRSVATRRFTVFLLAMFAALAVVLALAGVYGVLAYSVTRRTAEIGVRLALGAAPSQVLRLVVAQGLRPVAIGLAIGLVLALLVSRLMRQASSLLPIRAPMAENGSSSSLRSTMISRSAAAIDSNAASIRAICSFAMAWLSACRTGAGTSAAASSDVRRAASRFCRCRKSA